MKYIVASLFLLSLSACSVQKNLPATCAQQLKNLTSLEKDLVSVRAALEVCASQPPTE